MTRRRYYWCPGCAVFGMGEGCWCCGSEGVERETDQIDTFLKWNRDEVGHRNRPGGGRQQPLLTG